MTATSVAVMLAPAPGLHFTFRTSLRVAKIDSDISGAKPTTRRQNTVFYELIHLHLVGAVVN